MSQRRASYENEVETPNGPALPIGQWFNRDDPDGVYYLVRHRKGANIDLAHVVATTSQTNTNGWAVVYRAADVTMDGKPLMELP